MAERSRVPQRGVRKRGVFDDSGRWTAHRKAAVLKEIFAGELSVTEACARWELSLEDRGCTPTLHRTRSRPRRRKRSRNPSLFPRPVLIACPPGRADYRFLAETSCALAR
jgi:hypothetical protein